MTKISWVACFAPFASFSASVRVTFTIIYLKPLMGLLFLMFSAGCVTTANSTIGTIPEVESVAQPVLNSPEPPDWILGRGHKQFTHSQYLVGIGFSEKNTVSASESARAELSKNIRFKIGRASCRERV